MTNGLSSPKATDRPPGPTQEAARGAPPPSDAFAGVLDAHQARTAVAEGQSPDKSAPADDCAAPAAAPTDTAPAADPTKSVAAAVLAALPVPVTATAPEASAVAAPGPTQVEAASVVMPVPEGAPEAVEQKVAVPTAATPPAAVPVDTKPVTAVKPETPAQSPVVQQAAPTQAKPEPQPASAPAQPAPVAAVATPQAGEQLSQQNPQPQQQAKAQQAPAPAPQPQAPVAQPAAPTAPAAAPPAHAAHPALPTPTATPVPLARAAEAVEHVLRVATSSGGVTHARIALHPAELGSIDVHIRSTAEGLVARVVAHTAEAVQTLQHAANDLRQSLEEQGLTLLSLDIGQPSERDAGRAAEHAGGSAQIGDESTPGDAEDTTTETLRLPTGVLVDVLA